MSTVAAQHPAEALMGKEIEYAHKPAGKPKMVVVGKVVEWRHDDARIVDFKTNTSCPTYCLKIQPSDGGKAIWTGALPNTQEQKPYRD